MENNWIFDFLAVVLSLLAFIFSICQFLVERNRNRKEATIHAFDQLESSEAITYLFSCSKNDIDSCVKRHEKADVRVKNEWELLSSALPLLEHFAVGINCKVYDAEILNSMAGNKIISVHNDCKNLIQHKRKGVGNEKNYLEFEKMVICLKKLRNKKGQSIPQE